MIKTEIEVGCLIETEQGKYLVIQGDPQILGDGDKRLYHLVNIKTMRIEHSTHYLKYLESSFSIKQIIPKEIVSIFVG